MEARRQYFDPVRDSQISEQHQELVQEDTSMAVLSYLNEDVHMEYQPPVEELHNQETQQLALLYLPVPPPALPDQIPTDEPEEATSKIEFSTQWNNRKEAVWDIVAPKKGIHQSVSESASKARCVPEIWAENIYDAQDALPYFTAGQTILASKIPRELSRSVLLTRNLHDIRADWRSGEIGFTVQVRYKLQLNRPKKWKVPSSPGKLVNVNCKPMDPIQFRKLRASHEAGIPVRVLATGDFPSLPELQSEVQKEGEPAYWAGSSNWQNGVVMLGFFWVKKIMELECLSEKEDLETGKCSGRSKWALEFKSCDVDKHSPPWWRPIDNGSEAVNVQANESMREYDELGSENDAKRRRIDLEIDPVSFGDVLMLDIAAQGEECDRSKANATLNYPSPPLSNNNRLLYHTNSTPDRIDIPTETSSMLIIPEWHRRSHTEAVGPIGTFFRLDDGGHQPKVGLHQMAVRDEDTGLTFVEYWLAEAPMPIVAELNRVAPTDRRKLRRKTAPPKTPEAPQADVISSIDVSTQGPDAPTLVTSCMELASYSASIQSIPIEFKDGNHPDGGNLIRQRDPGGSRAVFSENTRMLFMHITCPQYPAVLSLMDQIFSGFATDVQMERQENNASYRTGPSALSCHYTYLAGCGTHIMHTSSPATGWEGVPDCVYDAHARLVDYQSHAVFENETVQKFNQSIYIMGNGATGTNTFRITHRSEDGPVGYMVFGASCSVEILVGNGDNTKRTTKAGATRRAEILLAHGDALMTMPSGVDAPLQIRVKRTGLAVVSIARYVSPESIGVETRHVLPQKRLPGLKKMSAPAKRNVTPAKRKARPARYPET